MNKLGRNCPIKEIKRFNCFDGRATVFCRPDPRSQRHLGVLHGFDPLRKPIAWVLGELGSHDVEALLHQTNEEGAVDILLGPEDHPTEEIVHDPCDLRDRESERDVHLGTCRIAHARLAGTNLEVQDHSGTWGLVTLVPKVSADHDERVRESLVGLILQVGLLHGMPP